jgi:tRNA A-37 threonylcarbamoyl transferase component Bud32
MFNPNLQSRLVIDNQEFSFSPHPAVPSLVWGQEGRHAIVYRLQNNGEAYALKVFRPVFRHDGLIDAANALEWYTELPGMRVCRQIILTRDTHPDVVTKHDDLDYAMIMPWIEGQTWFDYLQKRDRLTLDQSRALAESTAWVLYALELNKIAHCDLSSGNLIVDPKLDQIHLIDVEDLYSPWLEPPPFVPAGSIGYAHDTVREAGQWGPFGDRFAGALLIAEMLAWANPDVRKRAWGESYFDPAELQHDSERYEALRDTLRIYEPGFAEAFEQAWRSRSLDQCPPLKTWYDLLDGLPREPVRSWAPINPRDFGEVTPTPIDVAVGAVKRAASNVIGDPQEEQQGQRRPGLRGCRRAAVIGAIVTFLCCFATMALFSDRLFQ